jgi:hypothetical protein
MNKVNCELNGNNIDIDLDSKLRSGQFSRDKSKHMLKTCNYVNSGNINHHINSLNIDNETNIIHVPVLNQSKKSLHEYKCLNRFETLHRDNQQPHYNQNDTNRYGLGTRELYKKKKIYKNIN